MDLSKKIEAILFWKGEPISIKKLSAAVSATEEETKSAVDALENSLKERGLVIVKKEDEVMLGTSPDLSSLIEKLTKEELVRDLGKAGLETLSIVLYQGPISRSEIDYIRGVNSTFILRNLMIRGLVERVQNPGDQRSFLYKATFDLLQYLGVSKIEDLPEFSQVKADIESFKKQREEEISGISPEKSQEQVPQEQVEKNQISDSIESIEE